MELQFLGTSAAVPTKQRNLPSLAVNLTLEGEGVWLFDCGEGTQHQILSTDIKLSKISRIFITHLHGDHIYGLPGLLGTRSFADPKGELTVYGPPGIRGFVESALKYSGTHLTYPLLIREHEQPILVEGPTFTVTTKLLEHGMASYGYRIVEQAKPGSLLVEKLKKLGIPAGPIYGKLKTGEDITLADGRVLRGKDFVGPPKPGKVLTVLGDTRYCQSAIELAFQADVVVHEATFADAEQTQARNYFHSTSRQAALVAKAAGANRLILNHISSRYQDGAKLLDQARGTFPNTYLARDFSTFAV